MFVLIGFIYVELSGFSVFYEVSLLVIMIYTQILSIKDNIKTNAVFLLEYLIECKILR